MKVNISFVSPQIYPCYTGGFEIFNYHLIQKISEQGHKIFLITSCNHNWNQQNIHNEILRERILFLKNPSVIFHTLMILTRLRNQIDIIHISYTSNFRLIYPILIAKKLFGTPYVITIHGGGMRPRFPKMPYREFFQQADEIIAVSDTIKKEYERRIKKEIQVIPPLNPFVKSEISKDTLRSKYHFSNHDMIILCLGTIKRIKGNDILLKAFLKLGKDYIKNKNLKLVFVGDGPNKEQLEKFVKQQDFNEYVIFIGKIPYEKVPEMYKIADIYVIPSLFEGTPKSLVEAMYNNLPVIGTDTHGISNLISDNLTGLLFKSSDEKDLSIKLKKLIEDVGLRCELSKNAAKYIKEKFDYNIVVSKYLEIFENTIKK